MKQKIGHLGAEQTKEKKRNRFVFIPRTRYRFQSLTVEANFVIRHCFGFAAREKGQRIEKRKRRGRKRGNEIGEQHQSFGFDLNVFIIWQLNRRNEVVAPFHCGFSMFSLR